MLNVALSTRTQLILKGSYACIIIIWHEYLQHRKSTDCSRDGTRNLRLTKQVRFSKAAFTPRLSASSVERRANQRLHLGRDEVSDWLDDRC
ncbi:hypothetical protein TNCV_1783621 [Trichonephila clavipes]|nr:hypothetical protein TNCV_1783621 [Trichonephila clavipes]